MSKSINRVINLFASQTSDGTGSSFQLEPRDKDRSRIYEIVLDGDLGGGSFGLEISFDEGVTYVPWLLNGVTFSQVAIGYSYAIEAKTPMLVRGTLAGATSPNLNANLFYNFKG